MEVAEKLAQIRSEIGHAIPVMVNVSDQVRTQDVSKYPIFVVHPDAIEIGVPIIEKTEHNRWAIHISTLEEFATKQIIHPEKIDEFRQVFKDPDIYLCLFVLSDLGAQFVFMPVEPLADQG